MARRRRVRWVIDTMVVIRGARAFRQQPPAPTTPELRLLLGWVDDARLFDWLYSPPILDEYRTILRRLKVPAHAVGRFLNLLQVTGIAVETHNLGTFSPDPQDDPFYHCALMGHADAIVTDNLGDFPPLPGRMRPAILTPAAARGTAVASGWLLRPWQSHQWSRRAGCLSQGGVAPRWAV